MADPNAYEEDPEDVFDYFDDWKELVADTQPGGGGHATIGDQHDVLVGKIPFNKIRSARRYFLGYSYADEASPWKLHREPPARHPREPHLYVASFSAVGVRAKSNPDNPNREPYQTSPFTGTDGEDMYYADYNEAIVTLQFRSYGRMRFLSDEDIDDYTGEYKRWVVFGADPSVEALSADGTSQLIFREGSAADDPVRDSTPFPAPIAELMAKAAIVMTWRNVPFDYLSSDPDIMLLDQFLGKPTPLKSDGITPQWPCRLGTVNSTNVLGFYPGQLLLRAVKAEDALFPVAPADPDGYPLTGKDLTVVWEYFNPKKGYASDKYGHRLFPWRKTGKWYYATREETGAEMLPLEDHWQIFRHAKDADA